VTVLIIPFTQPTTVGYVTTNEATKNQCYNEQFLSIKPGCYKERRRSTRERMTCQLVYVFTGEDFYAVRVCKTVYAFIMESSIIVFTKERLFVLLKFTCTVYKSYIN